MADLLLELFSEEIPARMQAAAAKDLERLVIGALSDRGLLFEAAKAFSGPRRLTLAINGLPAKQPDVSEEKKGPRINAPEKAIEGFLRSAGVTLEQCEKRDDGKGEFYVAVIARKGRDTAEVLAEILPEAFAKLPWPKSMRFPGSTIRWVRPLHGIVCTLDGEVVPFTFAGVQSGDVTRGHRFLSEGPIEVRRFEDYEKKLHDAYVLIDPARRKEIIREDAKSQAFVHGLEPIEDEGLLDEVAGLAEWPVVLTGKIEDQFMDVPAEILQTSMRTHQKYFSTRDPKTGKLANRFIVVANMVTKDGGKEIIAGNERVLRARLSDAKFFWDQDRQTKLADRVDALKGIVFHAKLGTQYERVERIEVLARKIFQPFGLPNDAQRAARLCKADLVTGVVGEFPELQGTMGFYYALNDEEGGGVAEAIRDHYKPLGPRDEIPRTKLAMVVALADKMDTLAGFFCIDEKPTGSGDPYGLRRAALGAIRIVRRLGGATEVSLHRMIHDAVEGIPTTVRNVASVPASEVEASLYSFFVDRAKIVLREEGVRHDMIEAVFAVSGQQDFLEMIQRAQRLQQFSQTIIGERSIGGYRRAVNILKAEEKKSGESFSGEFDRAVFVEEEECHLADVLTEIGARIGGFYPTEFDLNPEKLMREFPDAVDGFFDKVKVNADNVKVRENRLRLLNTLREWFNKIADFSKIEG